MNTVKLPLIEKIHRTNDFYMERLLPDVGEIYVGPGEIVEPFSKIGESKVSYYFKKFDSSFVPLREPDSYIQKGVDLGFIKKGKFSNSKVFAPYNGFIRKVGDNAYVFEQEKEQSVLFSGVWGTVEGVVENKAVLVKGSAFIVYCAVSTPFEAEGELVVLPNPPELLEDPYFTNFTKEISGKIIYSGHFIKLDNLKKAIKLGVRGIIAGGIDKSGLDFALRHNFPVASLSGFGRIPTPDPVFSLFESVSNRYIFIHGESGEIAIPSKEKFEVPKSEEKKDFFIEVKDGMMVQVLERPYFGWLGKVSGVEGEKIAVKLLNGIEIVYVKPTNLLALSF